MHYNNWPHEICYIINIGLLAVTAVELFQKIVLTQSHICTQLYGRNGIGEQK